jgi:hypothetical protein
MTMYREVDPRLLADIGAHLGLATALLDQFVAIPKRMSSTKREELRALEQEARTAWEGLWDQLGQARELVRTLGRDISAYDVARRAAGDIWLDAARADRHTTYSGRTTIITWYAAPTAPAKAAIEALRAAVPEVVVSEPPPQDLELQPMRKRIEEYGPVVVILAAVTWAIVHFVL